MKQKWTVSFLVSQTVRFMAEVRIRRVTLMGQVPWMLLINRGTVRRPDGDEQRREGGETDPQSAPRVASNVDTTIANEARQNGRNILIWNETLETTPAHYYTDVGASSSEQPLLCREIRNAICFWTVRSSQLSKTSLTSLVHNALC